MERKYREIKGWIPRGHRNVILSVPDDIWANNSTNVHCCSSPVWPGSPPLCLLTVCLSPTSCNTLAMRINWPRSERQMDQGVVTTALTISSARRYTFIPIIRLHVACALCTVHCALILVKTYKHKYWTGDKWRTFLGNFREKIPGTLVCAAEMIVRIMSNFWNTELNLNYIWRFNSCLIESSPFLVTTTKLLINFTEMYVDFEQPTRSMGKGRVVKLLTWLLEDVLSNRCAVNICKHLRLAFFEPCIVTCRCNENRQNARFLH